jgi:hypothetical protein
MKNMEMDLSNVYIGCFSLDDDNLAMWRTQYGDDGEGCCAVFSKSFFYGGKNPYDLGSNSEYAQTIKLYKVHYSSDENIVVKLLLNDISKLIEKHSKKIMDDSKFRQNAYSILNEIRYFFKHDAYNHEKEIRLVLTADNAANKPYLDKGNNIIPKLYMNVNNPIILTKIILGPKVPNPYEIIPFLVHAGVEKVTLSKVPYR